MTEYATAQVTPGEIEARQLSAAKLRLGLWLAAEPGRTWDYDDDGGSPVDERPEYDERIHVALTQLDKSEVTEGHGPTLAAAILDAIAKASE